MAVQQVVRGRAVWGEPAPRQSAERAWRSAGGEPEAEGLAWAGRPPFDDPRRCGVVFLVSDLSVL